MSRRLGGQILCHQLKLEGCSAGWLQIRRRYRLSHDGHMTQHDHDIAVEISRVHEHVQQLVDDLLESRKCR